jgi:hypothetical protein
LIDNRSCARCLVVPAHGIVGGLGHENDACPWHDGRRTGRTRLKSPYVALGASRHPTTPAPAELQPQDRSDPTVVPSIEETAVSVEIKDLDGCSRCDQPARYSTGLCEQHHHEHCVNSFLATPVGI